MISYAHEEWRALASEFFLEYLNVKETLLFSDGTLFISTMRMSAKLLLDNAVFSSPQDMKKQALKDHNVVLPDDLFL